MKVAFLRKVLFLPKIISRELVPYLDGCNSATVWDMGNQTAPCCVSKVALHNDINISIYIYLHESIVRGHHVYRRVWSNSNSISVGRLLRGRPTGLFCNVVGECFRRFWGTGFWTPATVYWQLPLWGVCWHHSVITRWSITKLPDISIPAILHLSRTSTVRYDYITKESWMRGCLKSCMQKN